MPRKYTGKTSEKEIERVQQNGDIYVYLRTYWYDQESRNTKSKLKLLGIRNVETGEIEATRPKSKQSATDTAETPVTVKTKANAMISIVKHFSDVSGVTSEVKHALPKDIGRAQKILTLAWYAFATDGRTWTRAIKWTSDYLSLLPYTHGCITKDMYTDLFHYIGENDGIAWSIFEKRASQFGEGELIAWDSTVYECGVETVHDAAKGMTKEGFVADVYKVFFFYSVTSRKLICYVKIKGNLADSTTVPYAISMIKRLNIPLPEVLQDNGYTDDNTIGELLHSKYHFISRLLPSTSWIKEDLERNREALINNSKPASIIFSDPEFSGVACSITHTFHYVRKYKSIKKGLEAGDKNPIEATVQVFIYYSSAKKGIDDKKFREQLANCRNDLLNGSNMDKDMKTILEKYLLVTYKKDGSIEKIEPNQKAIDERFKYHGFLIIVADKEKDIEKALIKFRTREKIEERIKGHKSHTGGDTSKTGSDEFLDGELLVEFLADCIRESMITKINSLETELGVPNGESDHDSSEGMRVQLSLKRWLRKNSIANILDAFDTTSIDEVSSSTHSSKMVSSAVARDRLFLQSLNITDWGKA